MRTIDFFRGAGIASLIAFAASPALSEGKADRARAAIAEAHGKIDAANNVGAGGEVPGMTAQANAALKMAEADLAAGHKERAIDEAIHASALADAAIGQAQKNRVEAEQAQRANAENAAANAQQDAAAANARADSAEQAAAAAAADAQAARNAPPVLIAPAPAPAPTTTTVTTQTERQVSPATPTARRPVVKKRTVVRRNRTASPAVTEKTTTTVTTSPN